jgi:hypothetical protein
MSDTNSMMDSAPEHFICPLTMEVMTNPLKNVITGQSFEAVSIRSWMFIEGKSTCPLTRKPICPADFVENKALQREIQKWKEENHIVDEDEEDDEDDDDDAIFLEVLEHAKAIQSMVSRNTVARRSSSSRNDDSIRRVNELGAKILRQRDEKISKCLATRTPSSSESCQNIPTRPIDSIFEMYQ